MDGDNRLVDTDNRQIDNCDHQIDNKIVIMADNTCVVVDCILLSLIFFTNE